MRTLLLSAVRGRTRRITDGVTCWLGTGDRAEARGDAILPFPPAVIKVGVVYFGLWLCALVVARGSVRGSGGGGGGGGREGGKRSCAQNLVLNWDRKRDIDPQFEKGSKKVLLVATACVVAGLVAERVRCVCRY